MSRRRTVSKIIDQQQARADIRLNHAFSIELQHTGGGYPQQHVMWSRNESTYVKRHRVALRARLRESKRDAHRSGKSPHAAMSVSEAERIANASPYLLIGLALRHCYSRFVQLGAASARRKNILEQPNVNGLCAIKKLDYRALNDGRR